MQDWEMFRNKKLFHIHADCRYGTGSEWYRFRFVAMKLLSFVYMMIIPCLYHGLWRGLALFTISRFHLFLRRLFKIFVSFRFQFQTLRLFFPIQVTVINFFARPHGLFRVAVHHVHRQPRTFVSPSLLSPHHHHPNNTNATRLQFVPVFIHCTYAEYFQQGD